MDAIAVFAAEVRAFRHWLLHGTDRDAAGAKTCLMRLLDLYRAGIALPMQSTDVEIDCEIDERVDKSEWRRAFDAADRLPLDLYAEVFDPMDISTSESVTGSLADDLADIYRDVVSGLHAYDRGDTSAAVGEWRRGLHSHWGAHATGAIRALHWWLCRDDIDDGAALPPC